MTKKEIALKVILIINGLEHESFKMDAVSVKGGEVFKVIRGRDLELGATFNTEGYDLELKAL